MTRESVRQRILDAVEREDITRRHSRIRLWLNETEYRTLTRAERAHLFILMREGHVEFVRSGGYPHGVGYYVRVPGRQP